MKVLAFLCWSLALFLTIFAVVYQQRDIRPEYGGTMGGEMTAGFIWVIVSALSAVGALGFVPWYWAGLVFFLVLGLSFVVRAQVAQIHRR